MNNRATKASWQDRLDGLISDTTLPKSTLSRYGISIIALTIANLLKPGQNALVNASQGSTTPFLTFLGVVMVTAWYGGSDPGIFATLPGAFISINIKNKFRCRVIFCQLKP